MLNQKETIQNYQLDGQDQCRTPTVLHLPLYSSIILSSHLGRRESLIFICFWVLRSWFVAIDIILSATYQPVKNSVYASGIVPHIYI